MTHVNLLTVFGSAVVLGAAVIAIPGCGTTDPAPTGGGSTAAVNHDHPSEGPHHGSLVELGNEEFHAEVVHDDAAGTVTVYVLDSAAKNAVPIDSSELVVNLSHDGDAEQFKLAAQPDANDPPGKASRFVSSDPELGEDLDHEGADAQLVVTISGKQYRAELAHDHDQEGHDHE